jgi:sugar lactone lactonase YvrE
MFSLCLPAQDRYRVEAFAGQPAPEGVAATASFLVSPQGLAVDASNHLYICEVNGHTVRKVDLSTGTIALFAGTGVYGDSGDGGPALNAQFSNARYVALDSAGNVYISDEGASRIRRIDAVTGTIATYAGTGTAGYNGDNIAATSANLNYPRGIRLDASDNLYIADVSNQRVRRVDAVTKLITTVAGTGTGGYNGDNILATAAQLQSPDGVAFDSSGRLYIADNGNRRVRLVDAGTKLITTYAGNGSTGYNGENIPATSAEFANIRSIGLDSADNLYIVDAGTNVRVREVDAATQHINTIAGNGVAGFSGDGGPAVNASLDDPEGIAIDSVSNLYVSDFNVQRVRRISSGIIDTIAGSWGPENVPATSGFLAAPGQMAVTSSGTVLIADTLNSRVRQVDAATQNIHTVAGTGVPGYSGDGGAATSATLNWPYAVALDNSGNYYIADFLNNRVRKVSRGVITTIAGTGYPGYNGDGIAASSAQLNYPNGVALDIAGNLYIADMFNNRIRMVPGASPSASIRTVAGTGDAGYNGDNIAATAAQLNSPHAITLDSTGVLYIADANNNRIRRVVAGTITTAVGTGVEGYSGDGGVGSSAEIDFPSAITLDPQGNLFIADVNNVIRRVIGGTGVITTVAGTSVAGYSGDGGPALSAQFNFLSGVASDSTGRILVADFGNDVVRRLVPQFRLTTAANPKAGGTVTPGGYFDRGASVVITATANPAFQFSNFSGTVSGTTNPITVKMNRTTNEVAHFSVLNPAITGVEVTRGNGPGPDERDYTIRLTNTGPGPGGACQVSSVTLTVTAGTGATPTLLTPLPIVYGTLAAGVGKSKVVAATVAPTITRLNIGLGGSCQNALNAAVPFNITIPTQR